MEMWPFCQVLSWKAMKAFMGKSGLRHSSREQVWWFLGPSHGPKPVLMTVLIASPGPTKEGQNQLLFYEPNRKDRSDLKNKWDFATGSNQKIHKALAISEKKMDRLGGSGPGRDILRIERKLLSCSSRVGNIRAPLHPSLSLTWGVWINRGVTSCGLASASVQLIRKVWSRKVVSRRMFGNKFDCWL